MIYKEIKSPITLTQGCMTQRGQGPLLASVRLLWAVGASHCHSSISLYLCAFIYKLSVSVPLSNCLTWNKIRIFKKNCNSIIFI